MNYLNKLQTKKFSTVSSKTSIIFNSYSHFPKPHTKKNFTFMNSATLCWAQDESHLYLYSTEKKRKEKKEKHSYMAYIKNLYIELYILLWAQWGRKRTQKREKFHVYLFADGCGHCVLFLFSFMWRAYCIGYSYKYTLLWKH